MDRRRRRADKAVAAAPRLTYLDVLAWDRKCRRRIKRLGPDAALIFGGPDELEDLAARGVTDEALRLLVEAKQHRLRVILGDE
jgi:hypothetical protein